MRIFRRAVLLWLALAATLPGVVQAHAMLDTSTPDIDATLASLPSRIVLTFTEQLTGDSSYSVLDASGATLTTDGLDASDPRSLSGPMPKLANGTYEIRWTAISSDDGFVERGSFKFSVALAAVTQAPTAAPTARPSAAPTVLPSTAPSASLAPSSSPSAAPSPSPSAAAGGPTGGGSTTDVLIPIAAMVVVIGAGLAWFLRRRGAA